MIKRYSLSLLSDTGEDDSSQYTDTDQSIEVDEGGAGDGDTPEDGDELDPKDSPITDPDVPPEDRPRPEDVGLSTEKVAQQSAQIREREETNRAKELQK